MANERNGSELGEAGKDLEAMVLDALQAECEAAGTPLILMKFDLTAIPTAPQTAVAVSPYVTAMVCGAERSVPWLIRLGQKVKDVERLWVLHSFTNQLFEGLSGFAGTPKLHRMATEAAEQAMEWLRDHGLWNDVVQGLGPNLDVEAAAIAARLADPEKFAEIEGQILQDAAGKPEDGEAKPEPKRL